MGRFANVVSKVRRMIKVYKMGKKEKIFKCCDQSLVYVVLCCEVKILSRFW